MTERLEVYKCEICGNMVEVLHTGVGELVCCNQPMRLLEETTEDTGYEKHLPVIEEAEHGFKVKVGSIPHPMEEKHRIEWVELVVGDKAYRQFLKPGDSPEALFCVDAKMEEISARGFCNIHGLWKK